jgi:C_GCAxxG_C_C family probable redox protein
MFWKRARTAPGADPVARAAETFSGGYNCTQAVLSAFGTDYGLGRDEALRIAGAFGSGMNVGGTCGAVTGALMVLGLHHAKVTGGRFLTRDRTGKAARRFQERFAQRNGTTSCEVLIGCNLGTPECRAAARRDRSLKERCPRYVRDAAEILVELLGEA